MTLKEAANDYWPNLLTGLAGGALGGGLTYLNTGREPDESEEDFKSRRRSNTMTGALGGTAAGAAIPTITNLFKKTPDSWGVRAVKGVVNGITPWKHPLTTGVVEGAGAGAAAGGILGKMRRDGVMKALGLGSGTEMLEKHLETLKNKTQGLTDAWNTQKTTAEGLWNQKLKGFQDNLQNLKAQADAAKTQADLFASRNNKVRNPAFDKLHVDAVQAHLNAQKVHGQGVHTGFAADPVHQAWQSSLVEPTHIGDARTTQKAFADAVLADKNSPRWRKILPWSAGPAEKTLGSMMPKDDFSKWRSPRTGARAGGLIGGVAAPIILNWMNQ